MRLYVCYLRRVLEVERDINSRLRGRGNGD